MKPGDMVHYVEQRMVEIHFIGIIIDGPNYRGDEATYKVWWTNMRNSDGSAKMGWWTGSSLRIINDD